MGRLALSKRCGFALGTSKPLTSVLSPSRKGEAKERERKLLRQLQVLFKVEARRPANFLRFVVLPDRTRRTSDTPLGYAERIAGCNFP